MLQGPLAWAERGAKAPVRWSPLIVGMPRLRLLPPETEDANRDDGGFFLIGTFVQVNSSERQPGGYIVCESGCWEWTGAKDRAQYGIFRREQAHRFVFKASGNVIPAGLTLDHLCGNHSCVRPEHLEPVTIGENILRARKAHTHCHAGHLLSGSNMRVESGRRRCRTCRRDAKRKERATQLL